MGWDKLDRRQGGGGLELTLKGNWREVIPGASPGDTRPRTGLRKADWGTVLRMACPARHPLNSLYKTPRGRHNGPC